MRPRLAGEIKPISVSQSATYSNDEALNGAHLAVDGDLDTQAWTLMDYTNAWFIAKLSTEYCIEKVLHYWLPDLYIVDTHTCSKDGCTCAGSLCYRWYLTVYYEDGRAPGNDAPSGCKLGDTVKIQTISSYTSSYNSLDIYELAIIGKGK